MSHPNVEKLKAAYDAFADGDIETITKDWADDIVWHIGGRSPLAKDYRGKEAILGFLGELMQVSGGTFRLDVRDICGNDDYVYVLAGTSSTVAGRDLTDIVSHVHRMENGLTVESWFFLGDQYQSDEAMAEAMKAGASS